MFKLSVNPKYTYINGKLLLLVWLVVGVDICISLGSAYYDEIQETQNINLELSLYEQQIAQEEAIIDSLKNDLDNLSKKYEHTLQANKLENEIYQQLYYNYVSEISFYSRYACLTGVSGSGVDIGIDDSQITGQPDAYLVHDEYLAEIINVLKGAGAQAIAINGQRVTANSECLCLGPAIRVNGVRLFAPYHIEAIGVPDTLADSFIDSDIYKKIKKNKLIVDIVKKEKIVIDKYNRSVSNAITELKVIE